MYQVSSNSFGAKFISPDHQTKPRISFFGLFVRLPVNCIPAVPSPLLCVCFSSPLHLLLTYSSAATFLYSTFTFTFPLPHAPRSSGSFLTSFTRCFQLLSPSFASSLLSLTRLSSLSLHFTHSSFIPPFTFFYLLTFSFTHLHCHSFS